jgi:hypothetical protein
MISSLPQVQEHRATLPTTRLATVAHTYDQPLQLEQVRCQYRP